MTPLTPSDLEARFEEAARTLARLPRYRPESYRSAMPTPIPEKGRTEPPSEGKNRLPPPGPAQISRLDEVLEWVLWLNEEERKLVWARALGLSWRSLCWRLGCSRTTAWRNWTTALLKLCRHLNAQAEKQEA